MASRQLDQLRTWWKKQVFVTRIKSWSNNFFPIGCMHTLDKHRRFLKKKCICQIVAQNPFCIPKFIKGISMAHSSPLTTLLPEGYALRACGFTALVNKGRIRGDEEWPFFLLCLEFTGIIWKVKVIGCGSDYLKKNKCLLFNRLLLLKNSMNLLDYLKTCKRNRLLRVR